MAWAQRLRRGNMLLLRRQLLLLVISGAPPGLLTRSRGGGLLQQQRKQSWMQGDVPLACRRSRPSSPWTGGDARRLRSCRTRAPCGGRARAATRTLQPSQGQQQHRQQQQQPRGFERERDPHQRQPLLPRQVRERQPAAGARSSDWTQHRCVYVCVCLSHTVRCCCWSSSAIAGCCFSPAAASLHIPEENLSVRPPPPFFSPLFGILALSLSSNCWSLLGLVRVPCGHRRAW